MGMFDYLRSDYPLPGERPVWATEFQTKDLGRMMERYVIAADGSLMTQGGSPVDVNAIVTFYDSNVVASGPGYYTADGSDAHFVEWCAVFLHGKLQSVEQTENLRDPACKRKHKALTVPTTEEIAAQEAREGESLLGKTICVWWGGETSVPYMARVVAENAREIVTEKLPIATDPRQGEFEVIWRKQRDCTFFDSIEDGKRYNDARKADWEARKQEFDREIAEKKAKEN